MQNLYKNKAKIMGERNDNSIYLDIIILSKLFKSSLLLKEKPKVKLYS